MHAPVAGPAHPFHNQGARPASSDRQSTHSRDHDIDVAPQRLIVYTTRLAGRIVKHKNHPTGNVEVTHSHTASSQASFMCHARSESDTDDSNLVDSHYLLLGRGFGFRDARSTEMRRVSQMPWTTSISECRVLRATPRPSTQAAHIGEFAFTEQHNTFHALGYAQEPSGSGYVGQLMTLGNAPGAGPSALTQQQSLGSNQIRRAEPEPYLSAQLRSVLPSAPSVTAV